jgi:hypothetical protein
MLTIGKKFVYDGSRYFWNSLFDVKFEVESESEVSFVLWGRGTKSKSDVKMKIPKCLSLWISSIEYHASSNSSSQSDFKQWQNNL